MTFVHAQPQREPILQQVFLPYWNIAYGHQSAIQLHNNLINRPLTVRPVLLSQQGSRTELPVVNLAALGNATIELGPALQSMGLSGLQKGSAIFEYQHPYRGALVVEATVTEPASTMIYTVIGGEQGAKARELHGVYWFPRGSGAEVFVALQNAGDTPIRISASLDDSAPFATLTLGPKQSQVVQTNVPGNQRAPSLYGKVKIVHDGPDGALVTSGWTEMESLGYSNMMTLHDAGHHQSRTLVGTQVFLGEQRDLFRTRRSFKIDTYLVLANTSNQPLRATPELIYESGGRMHAMPLAPESLAAGAVTEVDLTKLRLPQDAKPTATIRVNHDGPLGALLGRVFGVADRTFGFYSTLETYTPSSVTEVYWTLGGDSETLLTVTNFGNQEDSMTVVVTHSSGATPLPEFRLLPMQSVNINVREWRDRGLLPRTAESGGFRVFGSSLTASKLLVKEHVVSLSNGASAPFYGPPCWVVDFWIEIWNDELTVGQSYNGAKRVLWSDYGQHYEHWPPAVGTSDSGVVTTSNNYPNGFLYTAVGPGSAWIGGSSDFYPVDGYGTYGYFQDQVPVRVKGWVQISSVSANPTVLTRSGPGACTNVTAQVAVLLFPGQLPAVSVTVLKNSSDPPQIVVPQNNNTAVLSDSGPVIVEVCNTGAYAGTFNVQATITSASPSDYYEIKQPSPASNALSGTITIE